MGNKTLLFIMGCIILSSLVSANGIQVVQEDINVTKLISVDEQIIISLRNEEPFSFYDVKLKDNPHATMTTINELVSGESRNISITIISNEEITTELEIEGFYVTNVGASNETHYKTIRADPYLVNPCDITITKGDSVEWTSDVQSTVRMKKYPGGEPVDNALLSYNDKFTKQFITPQIFSYYFAIGGWPFPNYCDIAVLNDSGKVNDPQLNDVFDLSIDIQYPSTTMDFDLPVTDYTLDFFDSAEGVLTLHNLDDLIAKEIKLTGDWISFNENNFDIQPQTSKSIIYTIQPNIFRTEDTNKTHRLYLSAEGNFPTINLSIDLFVNHANIGVSNSSDADFLLEVFCPKFPNSVLCNGTGEKIVYKYLNQTNREVELTIDENTLRDMSEQYYNLENYIKTQDNLNKEQIAQILMIMNSNVNETRLVKEIANQAQVENESSKTGILLVLIMGCTGGFILLSVVLIKRFKKKNQVDKLQRW